MINHKNLFSFIINKNLYFILVTLVEKQLKYYFYSEYYYYKANITFNTFFYNFNKV